MTPSTANAAILSVTFGPVLPAKYDTPEARTLLLAIGLQESRFEHRVQVGGPAHGFWQFERGGGVAGVLNHGASAKLAAHACEVRGVEPSAKAVYDAIVADDLLACAFARLLLLTDPAPLPDVGDIDGAWDYYLRNWRPGKPHRKTWERLYLEAMDVVVEGSPA